MSGALLPPIPLYIAYSKNELASAQAVAKSNPATQSLISYFQTVAPTIKTPEQLLSNTRALSVVLGAFGVTSYANETAVLKQLLTQSPTAQGSLASTIGNAKLQAFAEAFSNWGTKTPLSDSSSVSAVVNAFEAGAFEQQAGTQAPGLQNALYFSRNIGSITTITQLQSDSTLLEVAVAVLGVPYDDFAQLDFAQQTSLINSKIKASDFTNPTWVNHTAEQYLVQQTSSTSLVPTITPGSIESLFSNSTSLATGNSLLSILDTSLASTGTTASAGSLLSLFT